MTILGNNKIKNCLLIGLLLCVLTSAFYGYAAIFAGSSSGASGITTSDVFFVYPRVIEEMGRNDIEMHDIRRSLEDKERLIRDGGMLQVPCLFIDGKPLYESDDIIAWLRENP